MHGLSYVPVAAAALTPPPSHPHPCTHMHRSLTPSASRPHPCMHTLQAHAHAHPPGHGRARWLGSCRTAAEGARGRKAGGAQGQGAAAGKGQGRRSVNRAGQHTGRQDLNPLRKGWVGWIPGSPRVCALHPRRPLSTSPPSPRATPPACCPIPHPSPARLYARTRARTRWPRLRAHTQCGRALPHP